MNSHAWSLTLAAMLAASSGIAIAQVTPEEHATHHADQAPAAPPSATSAAKPGEDMRVNMQRMQSLMTRLGQTTDPAKRRSLLAEHRELMRQQIDAMKQMHCDMGMLNGGMGMMRGASKDGTPSSSMAPCHEMMEMRMEMMTGMMEQMLLHDEAREGSATKR